MAPREAAYAQFDPENPSHADDPVLRALPGADDGTATLQSA
jgi:hypothetical protein